MNIIFISFIENCLTKSYYPRREYAMAAKKECAIFIRFVCVYVRVCCECLCCCCCCSCCSCWHIVSGIRKNTYTTSIHSETRYSHGALTGELNQIEVLYPAFLSVSLTFSLVLSLFLLCLPLAVSSQAGGLDVRPLSDEVVAGLCNSNSIEFSVVFGLGNHMLSSNYLPCELWL